MSGDLRPRSPLSGGRDNDVNTGRTAHKAYYGRLDTGGKVGCRPGRRELGGRVRVRRTANERINPILPTSGVTMGVMGMAQIPWDEWFRWMLPLQICFFAVAMVLLTIAVLINYQ